MAATGQVNAASSARATVLPYAGFQLRAVAFILDLVVAASFGLLFFTIGALPMALSGDSTVSSGEEQWLLIVMIIYVPFIPFLFFLMWALRGQSLGMIAVRIEVTDRDGEPLAPSRAFLRSLVWPLSILPFALGAVPIAFDEERRALHDMLAGTVVLELP